MSAQIKDVANDLRDIREGMLAAQEAMAAATAKIGELSQEVYRLRRLEVKYRGALEEIHDHALDKYDGPEDRTHGPYLSMAAERLGIHP